MTLVDPSITRPRRTRRHAPKPEPVRSGQCFTTGCDSEVHGYSAFCDEHTYVPPGQQPHGSQCLCTACGVLVATTRDFTRHQTFDGKTDAVIHCKDPADMGLVEEGGVWASPESHARRERIRLNPPWRGQYPSQTAKQPLLGTGTPPERSDGSQGFRSAA